MSDRAARSALASSVFTGLVAGWSPGRWLGVNTRSGEDRRRHEGRSGKERRVALTAPDDHCPHCGAVGKLESVGSDDQSSWNFTHACDPYKAAERYRRDHPSRDTIQIANDDADTRAAFFVNDCLGDDFINYNDADGDPVYHPDLDDDDVYTGPSFRRDQHGHGRLGVHPRQGIRWGLLHRWGRAVRGRIPSSSFYVASPGLQRGSERGPTGGAR